MLLRFGHCEQRRLQTLLATLRHRWRRILFFLFSTYIFSVYARRKHPFLHRAHEITGHDVEFEIVHPPVVAVDTNGFLPLPAAKALCSTHRWPIFPTRNTKRKIYDLIMVNNEMDWLEIRLSTMDAHVDYFVIVESAVTFTGLEKALVVQENWDRFEKWHKKIIYHVLENPPKDAKRTWDMEDFQRNAMFGQVLPALEGEKRARRGDVIIVADVDEILRPAALLVLRNCDVPRRVTLRSQFYYYGFQWLHRGEWAHPQATTYEGPSNTIQPADLRNGEGGNGIVAWWNKADLWNAGWHCSSCFKTVEDMLNKMASFSHTGLNQEVFRDKMRIVDRVRKGKDLWDREGEVYERVERNWDIPDLLTREKERFGYLLDRDGPNAGFTDTGPGEVTAD
jgi:beta-1,4-mannosyl-glycoprotein beta-1,4-N-acetylglucosaminyltransferase